MVLPTAAKITTIDLLRAIAATVHSNSFKRVQLVIVLLLYTAAKMESIIDNL